jgi:3-hydroxybutyryl-CoA dehydrogenase
MAGIEIKKVGVLGSGIMGSGLAEVMAKAGYEVIVRSRSKSTADAMVASLDKALTKQVERGKLEAAEREAVLARVLATDHLGDLHDCDLVVESVVEDLGVKKALFAELEQVVKEGAILATNTSTLPVIELAMVTQRPELVCGIHFFNPAPAMKPGRGRPADHRRSTRPSMPRWPSPPVRQGRGRGQGPGRVHRERTAVPVPQQRSAHV